MTRFMRAGEEWVQTVKGCWHWARSNNCRTIYDGIAIVRLAVLIEPPPRACKSCRESWNRYYEYQPH